MAGTDAAEAIAPEPPPNEMDVFYKEWAREAVKRDLVFVNDTLARFALLSAAFAGGGLFFLTDWNFGLHWYFRGAVLLFLVAFLCACRGMLTGVAADVFLLAPEQVRQYMQRVHAGKRWWLERSTNAFLCGLALAAAGVLLRSGPALF